ncbi:hypothetical protein Aperf_G00000101234 [Anoplocephala perfoliata]
MLAESFDESRITDFDFESINRNLFEDFNEPDRTLISKAEPMPVYLRIRPLNSSESLKKVLIPLDSKRVVLKPAGENRALLNGSVAFGQASHEFVFSRVFDELSTQNDIFKVIVLDRVSEFLEGVNGLVFAYGTSSSGKTYSLQGTPDNVGVVPRALECVFRSARLLRQPASSSTDGQVVTSDTNFLFAPHGFNEIEQLSVEEAEKRRREKATLLSFVRNLDSTESNRTDSSSGTVGTSLVGDEGCMEVPFAFKVTAAFAFWISFVEIYNEVVYDLLDPEFVSATLKSSGFSQNHSLKLRRNALDLRANKKGHVFVKVESFDESRITDFDFESINRNLFEDFNEPDRTLISKAEPMPVYLRIRPLNSSESSKKVLIPLDSKRVVLKPAGENRALLNGSVAFGQASHEFVFSRVFDELSTQNDIFKVIVLDRVSEFLEGVNGLVFAYGTSSSGKTYSLQGTPDNVGVVPRALECVFRSARLLRQPASSSTDGQVVTSDTNFLFAPHGFNEIEQLSVEEAEKRRREKATLLSFVRNLDSTESNRTDSSSGTVGTSLVGDEGCREVPFAFKVTAAFAFWISFVEIYNEVVYDLLDPEFVSATLKSSGFSQNHSLKLRRNALDLRANKKGHVFVKGVRWYAVNSASEAIALLSVGRRCQAVSATRLNTASSRSHAIFSLRTLRVSSRGSATIDFRSASLGSCSELVFCDLAGSERVCRAETNKNSSRLREANSINTSLLALGKCIAALRSLAGHQVRNRPGVIVPSTCYPVVPYRESRLTRLFANFFLPPGLAVASSKACLLVNAAPSVELADETLHALRFSALASQVILPRTEPTAPPPMLPNYLEGSEEEEESNTHSRVYSSEDPDATLESIIDSSAVATAAIEKQLQAHLLRRGFQLRCSGSLIGRNTLGSARPDASSRMSGQKTSTSSIHGALISDSDPSTSARCGVSYPSNLYRMEDIESDLAGLSRRALISAIVEVVSALADTLPAEVEAAQTEVNDHLTKTFGDELLRMEEQYESLLMKQERDYEEKLLLLKSKQYRQRRWTLTPSSQRHPAKTRRIDGEECEIDFEAGEVNLDDNACPFCTKLEAEKEELRSKLEEAKSDLAEQSEVMVALFEQRDALQVDLRRAQFLAQLSKTKSSAGGQQGSKKVSIFPPLIPPIVPEGNKSGAEIASPTCETSPAPFRESLMNSTDVLHRLFPPFLSAPRRLSMKDCDSDPILPTPTIIIPMKKRSEGSAKTIIRLRAEEQRLLVQLTRLRADLENLNLAAASQQEGNELSSSRKEAAKKAELQGRDGRSTAAQMDSFLAHESEAEKMEALVELESRCSALNAELSEVRFACRQALKQLEKPLQCLADYKTTGEKLEKAESRGDESEKDR